MESIWSKTVGFPPQKVLDGDITTEVAVIGCGLAGALTAYFLQKKGLKTIVLEASAIGSGQTKNTTAKITSQHGLIYAKMIKQAGLEKAKKYGQANQEAIEEYKRIINEENIDCHFEDKVAYLYSTEDSQPLKDEAEAARQLGVDAFFTQELGLPFSVSGGVGFNGQGQFHPLEFLKAITRPLDIYENTRVKNVEGNELITEKGIVRADKIVFATHYPFINTPGYYFSRMHQERSYVIALENAQELDGMYLSIDEGGYSFRNFGELLFLGGANHRTGENSLGGRYDELRSAAADFYPNSREVANWSAQDCMTLDGIPYIGRYSASTPDWYVATGFKKWGMTTSMVSAKIITDLIMGINNPYAEVFSPQRFKVAASAKSLLEDGRQAIKGLAREFLKVPEAYMDYLPNGHGGIVEYEDQKVGAYKGEDGRLYFVSTKCPHLGCQLEWNPDEKTWDCPCHGSRFDYEGNLISNPANTNLDIYHN